MTYITPNIKDADGSTIPGAGYETTIAQVWLKGCEIKPIGKTGYFSEKIPASGPSQGSTGSTAPAVYRLRDQNNKVIDQFLSIANLKASMKRRGIISTPTKKETIAQAYERGYDAGLEDEREYQTAKWKQKIRLGNI